MHAFLPGTCSDPGAHRLLLRMGQLGFLLLPLTLLLIGSVRVSGAVPHLLWLGALFQLLACVLCLADRQNLSNAAVLMLYVIALSWIPLGAKSAEDWFLHLAQALLLVVPLLYLGMQCLQDSGAAAYRLAHRLGQRRDWPQNLHDCRLLAEVKALRAAVHEDAEPALALLAHPRPQVRVAALAALEFRPYWRPGQPQRVLRLAQTAVEPEVRAAAINALAQVTDRNVVEALAEFLCDASPLVRQTAANALLWNSEQNWPWIRLAVRRALANPAAGDDGPLCSEGGLLAAEAVADLIAWISDKGVQAQRAALTLGCHYHRLLSASPDAAVVEQLRGQLSDSRTAPLLRLELARVLGMHRELDADLLRQLLDSANPAPLRLFAVETLLGKGRSAEAVAALRELARTPNREIALGIAQVIQHRLGIDLGLRCDRPLPSLHSREAAEIARRVLAWATHPNEPEA